MGAPAARPRKRGNTAGTTARPRPRQTPRLLAYPDDPDAGERLLSPHEVAAFTGLPVKTLSEWRYHGIHLRYHKLGNAVRYKESDIAEWLARNLRDVADETLTVREQAALKRRLAEVLAELREQGITDTDGVAAFLAYGGLARLERDADDAERAAEDRLDGR